MYHIIGLLRYTIDSRVLSIVTSIHTQSCLSSGLDGQRIILEDESILQTAESTYCQ